MRVESTWLSRSKQQKVKANFPIASKKYFLYNETVIFCFQSVAVSVQITQTLSFNSCSVSMRCKSDTTEPSVAQLSILGQRRSKALSISSLSSPSFYTPINQPISVWLRCYFLVPQSSVCVCQNSVCFCSVMDLHRILFVSKGKQLEQCICVCLCAWVSECVYQREKSRRSRLSLNKLISRLFVRLGTALNKI